MPASSKIFRANDAEDDDVNDGRTTPGISAVSPSPLLKEGRAIEAANGGTM